MTEQKGVHEGKETSMKIGIIGGSGLDDPDIIKDLQSHTLTTAYGEVTVKSLSGLPSLHA